MTIPDICKWLEGTPPALFASQSPHGFQILVAVHLLGIILSVGTLLWVDLRLLGICMRRYPISQVYRSLASWFSGGFAVMFVSGAILFSGFATSAYENLYFRIKIVALVLAGANALIFHFTVRQTMALWDTAARPPVPAQIAGFISIILWAVVILAGRMISYTMF